LYAASTFYHSCRSAKLKDRLQVTDHCGIYLLIAGSYTPFVLVTMGGTSLGWGLFVAIWTLAVTFIVLKLIYRARFMPLWVVSYLLMGWLGVLAMRPLFDAAGWGLLSLIVLGGAAYTLGVVFYSATKIKHHHAIWHVFVMLGSLSHFLAVAIYVRPN
jgi:hemolysin III